MASSPQGERDERDGEVVAAIRAALPTSRHADMALDAVLALLGEGVVVETADEGRRVRVFRRDPVHADWIVPWPLIQFSRGRRLGYIMGAEGPPSDEPPPGRDAPPLRLGGLTSGEFEISDGRLRLSVTFGQDGRFAETGGGGPLGKLFDFAQAVRTGGRNAVEVLSDHLVALDAGETGPGRLLRPTPSPAAVDGAWQVALDAVRDAILDGRVPSEARWVAADGFAGTVICTGATREEVIDRCHEEIQRRRPVPPAPTPPPELSAETLAAFGLEGGGPFLISSPALDGPRIEPTPENTPIALIPLAPLPPEPPPFGTWLRLLDERGASSHAVLRRDGTRGVTVVSPEALKKIEFDALDALLDAADEEAAARGFPFRAHGWPPELPRLNSSMVTYAITERVPGVIVAEAGGSSNMHGFAGNALRPDRLGGGLIRQRWVD